jgi:hypothetical protein
MQRPLVVLPHDVGATACADLRVRNRSVDEPLVITRPFLVNNTIFGIPPAQLPLVIPPGQERILTVCCAAVDTGDVADTLYLPDTCSPAVIPIVSSGNAVDLFGTSRCDVATQVTIIRAGLSYRTSPPYPMPADQGAMFTIVVPQQMEAPTVTLRDGTLREIRRVHVASYEDVNDERGWTYQIPTDDLPAGVYVLVVTSPEGIYHVAAVPVIH